MEYTKNKKWTGGNSQSRSAQMSKFDNGCVFIHQQCDPTSFNTSIRVFCKVGSINESPEEYGTAHLVEHLCFQTNHPDFSKIASSSTINASTSKEYTEYKMDITNDNLSTTLNLLAHMLFSMEFTQSMIDSELNPIYVELSSKKYCDFDKHIFKGTGYEHDIDSKYYHRHGNVQYLEKDVNSFYKYYYVPSNMIVSIVSQSPWETILDIIKNTMFYTANIAPPSGYIPNPIHTVLSEHNNVSTHDGNNLEIAFRVCPYTHEDAPVLELIDYYFSHGFANILFNELRSVYKETYTSRAYYSYYKHVGAFGFIIILGRSLIDEYNTSIQNENNIIDKFIDVLDILKKNPETIDWNVVKQFMLNKNIVEFEKNSALAHYNGEQYFFYEHALPITYTQYHESKIVPITIEHIKTVANKYFNLNQAFVFYPTESNQTIGTTIHHRFHNM